MEFSGWLRSHPVLASFVILACALSARLFFVLAAEPSQLLFPDSGTYFETAVHLQTSGVYLNRYQRPEITRTPGYPFFLAVLMTCVKQDLRTLLLTQAIIVSVSVVILYWLARHILPPLMAFTGAVLAAISPWGAVRAGFLLTDGLFLLVLALLFFAMYAVVRFARTTGAVLLGGSVVGGLTSGAVLVRPVFPLIALVALVLVALYPERRVRVWLLVAAMLVCALVPLHLWKMRNLQEAQFHGFSDVSGKAAWQWLASSVKAHVPGASGDRWAMLKSAEDDETHWTLSLQQADDERWRLAKEVFTAYPVTTVYVFVRNGMEAFVHPEPDILAPAGLRFAGDTLVLGGVWMAFIVCAVVGMCHVWSETQPSEVIDRNWLLVLLIICSAMTATAGVSFGAGARYRMPLELIVPLLAGVGLVRMVTVTREKRWPTAVGMSRWKTDQTG